MAYETFKRQRAPEALEPFVTVHRRGTIALNTPAWHALGSPASVEFLFDRSTRKMALRAVDDSAAHGYRLRQNGTSAHSYVVSGTAFFQYYEIPLVNEARRLAAQPEDGMLVVDLNQDGAPALPGLPLEKNRRQKKLPEPIRDP